MNLLPLWLLAFWAAFAPIAFAHHLDDYDARIRGEAALPAEWFACKSARDCELVSVPCQSDLAVNASHVDQAREALIQRYPFCLGTSLHDTEALCKERRCATESSKHIEH